MAIGPMSKQQREAFLADVHVGILAIDEPGRGPFALPIWYVYEEGEVRAWTMPGTLKHRLVEAAGRATLTVQTETPPYRYVSVEGPVVVDDGPRDVSVAIRYLGPERGAAYGGSGSGGVRIRLTPEHWRTADYGRS
jgi:hypothetical protein